MERAKEAAMEAGEPRVNKALEKMTNFIKMMFGAPEAAALIGREGMEKAQEKMTALSDGIVAKWDRSSQMAQEKTTKAVKHIDGHMTMGLAKTTETVAGPVARAMERVANIGAGFGELQAKRKERLAGKKEQKSEKSLSNKEGQLADAKAMLEYYRGKVENLEEDIRTNTNEAQLEVGFCREQADELRTQSEQKRMRNADRFSIVRNKVDQLRTHAQGQLASS